MKSRFPTNWPGRWFVN
ncbi:hypothetical protein ACJIZ3_014328 [Penstemon smallii]|uniref:Uncharacterized protein n=1 Tax=Penstemon smallii TaxID=265156 RepID=A0ABD3RUG5_9LAMI